MASRSRLKAGLAQLVLLFRGYLTFRRKGLTPDSAYASLRGLYCLTRGFSNRVARKLFALRRRPYRLGPAHGVLGTVGSPDLGLALAHLRDRGYVVFDRRLDEKSCKELLSFARRTPSLPMGEGAPTGSPSMRVVFDPAHPLAPKYDFAPADLMRSRTVQELVSDPTLLALAQDYLGCQPVIDIVSMWWSTTARREASSAAAQLYHFDMDRFGFLKFFFYLTEVDRHTGPHAYVAGSHRHKPKALWRDGRIPDEELLPHFAVEDIVEIVGPIGTMFAADTSGFHKGTPLERATRLLFQIQFSTDLFGYNLAPIPVPTDAVPRLREAMARYPYIYSSFRS